MLIPHAKELLSGQFLAAQGGSFTIENTYPKLSQIVLAKFELGRVKQLNPASDCGITVLRSSHIHSGLWVGVEETPIAL